MLLNNFYQMCFLAPLSVPTPTGGAPQVQGLLSPHTEPGSITAAGSPYRVHSMNFTFHKTIWKRRNKHCKAPVKEYAGKYHCSLAKMVGA